VTDELLWAKKEHKNMTTQGKKAFTKMLALSTPPTAILAHNDLVAFGMFQKAWEIGCKIPEDVSIIGFDDIPYAECSIPPLTTFQQSSERSIAGTLLDMIFTRMKAPEALKQEFIARPKLILRKSTTLAKSK
jgi:DNA-binding LacI/PurR family transcriptional regulator